MTRVTATGPDWLTADQPVAYPDAVRLMRGRTEAIRQGVDRELVWLLQHPALYTSGTSARAEDLADSNRFETFSAGRGGQWTYHGPGQLVAYVMLDLSRAHGTVPARDTHAYVFGLEAWLMATLATFGVHGERRAGRVGIWVTDRQTGEENKVAAIGVRITRWVSWHGVSLNVCPNLDHFTGIVPCGIREHGVTSLEALGAAADMTDVQAAMRTSWTDVFGV